MTSSQTSFGQELIAYWISFVRAQNPNTYKLESSPEWPPFSKEDTSRMVLQLDNGGNVLEKQDQSETDRCDFLASIADELEN
jgi:carboxylesterase type B